MKPFNSDTFLGLLGGPSYRYKWADSSNIVRLVDDIEVIAPKIELVAHPDRITGSETRRWLVSEGYELLGAEAFYLFLKNEKLMPDIFKEITRHDDLVKIFFDADILLSPYYRHKKTLAFYRYKNHTGRMLWRYETCRMDSFRSADRTSAVYRR